MKTYIYILIGLVVLSCNSEDANDCFQRSGTIVQDEVTVPAFEKILVNRDVELILKQGNDIQVIVETGENLRNDIDVKVVNDQLQLSDNNTCNYVRDYGVTKIYVTAPNITHIRSSTQYDISSDGVLNYESLRLFSEDFNATDSYTVGDFKLEIDSQELTIASNNISSFYISGQVEDLLVRFFAGSGRFHAETLIAEHVEVYHRGSNDMIVNPQESLTGEIVGTGNVIALNNPTTVAVETPYVGQLIFE